MYSGFCLISKVKVKVYISKVSFNNWWLVLSVISKTDNTERKKVTKSEKNMLIFDWFIYYSPFSPFIFIETIITALILPRIHLLIIILQKREKFNDKSFIILQAINLSIIEICRQQQQQKSVVWPEAFFSSCFLHLVAYLQNCQPRRCFHPAHTIRHSATCLRVNLSFTLATGYYYIHRIRMKYLL